MQNFILNLTQNQILTLSCGVAILSVMFIFYHGIIKTVKGEKTLTNFFKKVLVYVFPAGILMGLAIAYPVLTISTYSHELLTTHQLQGDTLTQVTKIDPLLTLGEINNTNIVLKATSFKALGTLDCGPISIRQCLDIVKINLTKISKSEVDVIKVVQAGQ